MQNQRLIGIRFLLAVVSAAIFGDISSLEAASGDYTTVANVENVPQGTVTVHVYGLTVGIGGKDLPAVLSPDYTSSNPGFVFDVTAPLYIAWEAHQAFACPDDCAEQAAVTNDNPRPLAGEKWFQSLYDQIYVSQVFTPTTVGSPPSDEYVACPPCGMQCHLDAPGETFTSAGFNSSGELRISDVHGGIGTLTYLQLRADDVPDIYIMIVQWNRPATYRDLATATDVDAVPGTIVARPTQLAFQCGGPFCVYDYVVPQHTVEWVSADITPATPGSVDAGDVAAFSSAYGFGNVPVEFGFAGGGAANFKYNINPFGTSALVLDAGDVSALSFHLNKACSTPAPKGAGADGEAAAILNWFGIAPTGADVVAGPHGATIPGYDIVDRGQNLHAQTDAFGYVHPTGAASNRSWTRVKTLYR